MIVRMRKLFSVCSKENYREVLKELYSLGCVEIERTAGESFEGSENLLSAASVDTGSSEARGIISSSLKTLDRYAPYKTSFLTPRDPLSEEELFNSDMMEEGREAALKIKKLSDKIDENNIKIQKAQSKIAFLKPWAGMDVPLEEQGTKSSFFGKGVLPVESDFEKLKAEVCGEHPECEMDLLASDREQQYITFICHKKVYAEVLEKLKNDGFTAFTFNEYKGTAESNIAVLEKEIAELSKENEALVGEIKENAEKRKEIKASYDAYVQESSRDELASSLARTQKTVILTGWVPYEKEEKVAELFSKNGCAWEFKDPEEGDSVPVAYKTNKFSSAFVGITDMYGTPTYDSEIDPNPLMSIFFFAFFGFMMGDAMYGVLIFLGSYLFLKLRRPSGTMKGMLTMFMYCGISTFIAGVLTGGWFGDSVAAVSTWLTGKTVTIPPLWFDPLSEPMTMLTFSLAIGAVQLIAGMGLSALRMIKKGHPLDAFFDIGSWWILFAGLGLYAVGMKWGLYVALVGVAILLLTGGRNKKGFGKITGGLGSLYNITSYVSDLLSYSRIMALGLSGAVVGQVVNKIATMGSGIGGIILFVFVFVLGHTFNIASSLLGAYVHSSRLQYIEFYGKFFEEGGRAFKPLYNNTKYVEIIKEEN